MFQDNEVGSRYQTGNKKRLHGLVWPFTASPGLSLPLPHPFPHREGSKTCGHCPAAFLSCKAHVYMSSGRFFAPLRMTGRAEGDGGEAGIKKRRGAPRLYTAHVKAIRAQPRHHRRGVKRRVPSRREKGQACLSVASSWPLAGEVPGAVPPVQPAVFLLGIFFFRLHERRSTLFCHAEHT